MSCKERFLSSLLRYHKSNKIEDRKDYPQSWWIVSKYPKWLQKVLQFLCEKIGGHEPSLTEWGYGGGEYADSWCRWCNKMVKVPKTSLWFKYREVRDLMKLIKEKGEI